MEKFSITRFVPEVLKLHSGERLTARQIALEIVERHPEASEDKRLRSRASVTPLNSLDSLVQQIVAEIGAQRKSLEERLNIKSTEERPRKYYYSTQSDTDDVRAAESDSTPQQTFVVDEQSPADRQPHRPQREAALYPVLSQFLFSELGIYSKRIDEKRSSNLSGPSGNKWLYPDVVGVEDLTASWKKEVIECVSASFETRTRLYSFEVKVLLNRSNVREAFFQAVSNSSWSNLPYLVTSEIQGSETLSELRVLSGTHGVGLIRLDPENPNESEILIPAKERLSVDWNSANRLATSSHDFTSYLNLVRHFYQTKDIRPQDWDYHG